MTPVALEWIARFRRYLSSERRLSAHTDQSYARDLAALVKFCDREGIDDWSALDSQHVRRFAAHSHGSGLAPRSIQRRLSALRSFYNFLLREAASESARTARLAGPAHTAQATEPAERRRARITGNPATEVRAPKATRRLPQTLDADQMARLLQMPAGGDRLDSRDRAMMELLYSSGLRLAEHVHHAILQIEARDIETHELREAQSRGIEQLHERAITRGQAIARRRNLQQPCHLVGIERLRQAPSALRSAHVVGGVAADTRQASCGRSSATV